MENLDKKPLKPEAFIWNKRGLGWIPDYPDTRDYDLQASELQEKGNLRGDEITETIEYVASNLTSLIDVLQTLDLKPKQARVSNNKKSDVSSQEQQTNLSGQEQQTDLEKSDSRSLQELEDLQGSLNNLNSWKVGLQNRVLGNIVFPKFRIYKTLQQETYSKQDAFLLKWVLHHISSLNKDVRKEAQEKKGWTLENYNQKRTVESSETAKNIQNFRYWNWMREHKFDGALADSVSAFQSVVNIPADGIVGVATYSAIEECLNETFSDKKIISRTIPSLYDADYQALARISLDRFSQLVQSILSDQIQRNSPDLASDAGVFLDFFSFSEEFLVIDPIVSLTLQRISPLSRFTTFQEAADQALLKFLDVIALSSKYEVAKNQSSKPAFTQENNFHESAQAAAGRYLSNLKSRQNELLDRLIKHEDSGILTLHLLSLLENLKRNLGSIKSIQERLEKKQKESQIPRGKLEKDWKRIQKEVEATQQRLLHEICFLLKQKFREAALREGHRGFKNGWMSSEIEMRKREDIWDNYLSQENSEIFRNLKSLGFVFILTIVGRVKSDDSSSANGDEQSHVETLDQSILQAIDGSLPLIGKIEKDFTGSSHLTNYLASVNLTSLSPSEQLEPEKKGALPNPSQRIVSEDKPFLPKFYLFELVSDDKLSNELAGAGLFNSDEVYLPVHRTLYQKMLSAQEGADSSVSEGDGTVVQNEYFFLPSSIDLSFKCSPVEDQGELNSCTAHAAISLLEYFELKTFGEVTDASRLFLYKAARNIMQRSGDVGASIRSTLKAMVLFGVPPEQYWPYIEEHLDLEPPAFCYSYASSYQTLKYFRLDYLGIQADILLSRIKAVIAAGLPCVFGFTAYDSIHNDTTAQSGFIPYPGRKDKVVGGHAVVAVGYDDNYREQRTDDGEPKYGALLIKNSWGKEWGMQGYGWLPYRYVLRGLTADWWSLLKAEWFDDSNFGLGSSTMPANPGGRRVRSDRSK